MNRLTNNKATVAIVGGGIVGLAHAYQAYLKGFKTFIFERENTQVGASVRNFGLIWPIGQSSGQPLEMALESRRIWEKMSENARFHFSPNTSIHLAYHADEWAVLNEFYEKNKREGYEVELLNKNAVLQKASGINPNGLKGALLSNTEANVHPVEAVRKISDFLAKQANVFFFPKTNISRIEGNCLYSGEKKWEAEKILICTGSDYEVLFPEHFAQAPLQKCKLQMMRTTPTAIQKQGPSLCAGLTLRHYDAFANCESLPALDARYDKIQPLYKKHGIHVLAVQNYLGEWVLGDTHEYGHTFDPFDDYMLNGLVLNYLSTFLKDASKLKIKESWHGIYAKHTEGKLAHVATVAPNTHVITGLGGAGMTLSFGLAARHFKEWFT